MQRPAPPNSFTPGTKLTVGSHRAVVLQYLSEGGFAHVYKVNITPKENGTSIACLKRVVVPDKKSLNNLRAEVDSMKRVTGYRHIVSYIDSHAARIENSQSYEVFVLMELCSNKGLIDFMNTRLQHRLTEPEVLRIMAEVTEGVANMHSLEPPLIHRDIKIENVLISDKGDYKLCDFGSSSPMLRPPRNAEEFSILQHDVLTNTTPQYRSPEMVDLYRGLPIDEKSDIWALGVFLYKICYYTTPFEAKGELAILHAKFDFPQKPVYSNRLKNLISVLLREDPRRRPNAYQTLEEVCRMRGVPVPISDYSKTKLHKQSSQPQPEPSLSMTKTLSVSPLPPITFQNNFVHQASRSTPDLVAANGYAMPSRMAVSSTSTKKSGPFEDSQGQFLHPSKSQGPPLKPPRPNTFSNIPSLSGSMKGLSLSTSGDSSKPQVPVKSKYVDSVVQTDDQPRLPTRPSSRSGANPQPRPQSLYVFSSQSRSNSGGHRDGDSNELKKIITGISRQSTTVELSPGENTHIDSSVDFLRNLESQDSGKSWVQQTTGGSISSIRRISTGSKRVSGLIGQLTGKLSRSHSRSSSRASSIHESAGIVGYSGSNVKYRSSSESIEEERPPMAETKKLTRSASIQRRIQGLLNGQGDPPVMKTAQGYGNNSSNGSSRQVEVDSDGFKKPSLLRNASLSKRKPPPPQTPPSLSAQTTPSTMTKTPKIIVTSSSVKSANLPTMKKAPPKPKKPSYLKSNSVHQEHTDPDATLTRTFTGISEMSKVSDASIPDIDDLEKNFEDRFPSAL